jgi:diphthamide biosynthesis methyltransferase
MKLIETLQKKDYLALNEYIQGRIAHFARQGVEQAKTNILEKAKSK